MPFPGTSGVFRPGGMEREVTSRRSLRHDAETQSVLSDERGEGTVDSSGPGGPKNSSDGSGKLGGAT